MHESLARAEPDLCASMLDAQAGSGASYRFVLSWVAARAERACAIGQEDFCRRVLLRVHRARASYDGRDQLSEWADALIAYEKRQCGCVAKRKCQNAR